MNFEIQYEVTRMEKGLQAPSVKFEHIGTEFKEFLGAETIEGLDKDRIYKQGLEYLTRV